MEKDKINFEKMKTMYDVCMDEEAIHAYGVEPTRARLAEFEEQFHSKTANLTRSMTRDELTDMELWLANNGVRGLVRARPGVSQVVVLCSFSGNLLYSTLADAPFIEGNMC